MGYKKHSEEEEKQLIEKYFSGAPVKALMEEYGYKTKKSITDKIKKYFSKDEAEKIISEARNNRKNYSIKFDGMTSEFNAYFLGLMLTDGYIQDNNKFGIDLIDEDCIRFLSNVTGKNYNTYYQEGKQPRYRIVFSDKESLEKLAQYGVVKQKSKILQGFEIKLSEYKFLPYLIRGIIDGDGCIYQTSYGAPGFYICSASKDFLIWLQGIFQNQLFFKDVKINKYSNEEVWRLESADQRNILKLISLVYDKDYGMHRKYSLLRKTFRDYNKDNLLLEG